MLCEQSAEFWNSKLHRADHNQVSMHHGRVNFIVGSQIMQRSIPYPVQMAALLIGYVSLLGMLVWVFQ